MIRSERVIFHETTNGPFRREDTIFAPWAPEESDEAAGARFLSSLADQVGQLGAAEAREPSLS